MSMGDTYQIRFSLQNVDIPIVSDRRELLSRITIVFDGNRNGQFITAINPEKIYRATKDSILGQALASSFANYADGVGVVMAVRLLNRRVIDRIPGIDLFQEILDQLDRRKGSVFLFGATEENNKACAEIMGKNFSNLRIVGRRHGFQVDSEDLVRDLNQLKPDLVAVALGSPAQEKWIYENASKVEAKLLMGVGGSFDVMSGQVSRAPRAIRRFGLEWLYRLMIHPSRIHRYSRLLFFVILVLKKWVANRFSTSRAKIA